MTLASAASPLRCRSHAGAAQAAETAKVTLFCFQALGGSTAAEVTRNISWPAGAAAAAVEDKQVYRTGQACG